MPKNTGGGLLPEEVACVLYTVSKVTASCHLGQQVQTEGRVRTAVSIETAIGGGSGATGNDGHMEAGCRVVCLHENAARALGR